MSASLDPPAHPRMVRTRYLAPGEVVVSETHVSRWLAFPGPTALLAALLVLMWAAAAAVWSTLVAVPWLTPALERVGDWSGDRTLVLYATIALAALGAVWVAFRYVLWWSKVYAVTDHRVLYQHGFFYRALDEIPVDQIRGVDSYQSFGQRILGYGTIRISSEGGRSHLGNEDWPGIPHPLDFQRVVESMVQAHSLPHLLGPQTTSRAAASVAPTGRAGAT